LSAKNANQSEKYGQKSTGRGAEERALGVGKEALTYRRSSRNQKLEISRRKEERNPEFRIACAGREIVFRMNGGDDET
jgi:hypothetical protein